MIPIKDWSDVAHKEFDVTKTYKKSELAIDQLRTAIWLFLNRIDFASAITLAGAAGNILHVLVEQQGKEPTLEHTRLLCDKLIGYVPKKNKYIKHFGDFTGINSLKHMSMKCPDTIEMDLEKCAKIAITRPVLDFIKLYGDAEARKNEAVNAFMQWLWVTHDGEKMMEEYNSLPAELKRKWD